MANDADNVTVLPAEGAQPFYDLAYQFGGFIKGHAVALSLGIVVGVLLCYMIEKKR